MIEKKISPPAQLLIYDVSKVIFVSFFILGADLTSVYFSLSSLEVVGPSTVIKYTVVQYSAYHPK